MLPVVWVGLNHTNLPDMLLFLQPIAYLCVSYFGAQKVLQIFWTLSSKNGYLTS